MPGRVPPEPDAGPDAGPDVVPVPEPADGPQPTDGPPVDAQPPEELRRAAEHYFGDRLPLAIRYAELLMTDGVVRGLIGPREAPRIWERHLLNCAAVTELVPADARVVDVGSGAGLPGVVLAVARSDLSVVLVEPLVRRTTFLLEVVAALGLVRTTVVRARAEEMVAGRGRTPRLAPADVVTARALAPLDRLTSWCLPLAAEGGRLLALKGESAAEEIGTHHQAVVRLGGSGPVIRRCGVGVIDPPTTVVEIVRLADGGRRRGR
jgi:16S rRNA (guanine527-N7)-methyltransferase